MYRDILRNVGRLLIALGGIPAVLFLIACSCRITVWTSGGQDGIFLGEGVFGWWTNVFAPHTGLTIEPPLLPHLWFVDIDGPGPTEKHGIPLWPAAAAVVVGLTIVQLVRAQPLRARTSQPTRP